MRALLVLLPLLSAAPLHAQVDRFDRWDKNKDGKLTPEEVPPKLRARFAEIDTDDDGVITREELRKVRPLLADSASYDFLHDIDYVGDGLYSQRLDLLLPKDREGKKLPLIIYIHGGGWTTGTKDDGIPTLRALMVEGEYATATINYRLTDEARWPAQIHDCKAAVRFLRSKATLYGIDPDRIGVMGASAGGHLVCLLGSTAGNSGLDGKLGPAPQTDSHVQCVVNLYGPSNLLTIDADGAADEAMTKQRQSYELKLFGAPIADSQAAAKEASPMTWIGKGIAPIFTAHGTKDTLVPFVQSEKYHEALTKAGVENYLIPMEGAGHGFEDTELNERVRRFFDKHLRGMGGEIPCQPIVATR